MAQILENAGKTVLIARRIQFSSGHLYAQEKFSPEKNRAVFGPCYTEHGHGHNYTLEAFFTGPIHPRTGLVVNLVDVDKLLKEVLVPLDHHHLNFDVPYFKNLIPTTENIAQYCKIEIQKRMGAFPMTLTKIRLYELDDLWVELDLEKPLKKAQAQITLQFELRALHNLENPDISDVENQQLYGLCYRLHGHNYKIMVTLQAPIDEKTGLSINRDQLKQIVHEKIIARFEGSNLNDTYVNTSGEALVCTFFEILEPHLPNLKQVAIQETRKNYFAHTREMAQLNVDKP